MTTYTTIATQNAGIRIATPWPSSRCAILARTINDRNAPTFRLDLLISCKELLAEQNQDSCDQCEDGHQDPGNRQRREPRSPGEDQPDREQEHSRAASHANGHERHLQEAW